MKHSMETTSGAITLKALRKISQKIRVANPIDGNYLVACHSSVDEQDLIDRGFYPVAWFQHTTVYALPEKS